MAVRSVKEAVSVLPPHLFRCTGVTESLRMLSWSARFRQFQGSLACKDISKRIQDTSELQILLR